MSEVIIRIEFDPAEPIWPQIEEAIGNLRVTVKPLTKDEFRELGRAYIYRARNEGNATRVRQVGDALFVFDDEDHAMRLTQRRFSWARGIVAEMTDANIGIALTHLGIELFSERPEVLAETLVSMLVQGDITEDDLTDYR